MKPSHELASARFRFVSISYLISLTWMERMQLIWSKFHAATVPYCARQCRCVGLLQRYLSYIQNKCLRPKRIVSTNYSYLRALTIALRAYPKKHEYVSSSKTSKNFSMLLTSGTGSYLCHFKSLRIQYIFQTFWVRTYVALAKSCPDCPT